MVNKGDEEKTRDQRYRRNRSCHYIEALLKSPTSLPNLSIHEESN